MKINDVPEILRLSVPEKILFVEDLWDSISSVDSDVPVPESHKNELDYRLKKHYSLGELLSIKELQARIEKMK